MASHSENFSMKVIKAALDKYNVMRENKIKGASKLYRNNEEIIEFKMRLAKAGW